MNELCCISVGVEDGGGEVEEMVEVTVSVPRGAEGVGGNTLGVTRGDTVRVSEARGVERGEVEET